MSKVFYLGRFNLNANYDSYEQKEIIIRNSLSADVAIDHLNFRFKFSKIDEVSISGRLFFVGYLIKYSKNELHPVVDEKNREVTEIEVENEVISLARFVLENETGLIVYNTPSRHFNIQSFANRFTELIERANDNFFIEAKIETIEDRGSLLDRLRTMRRIKEIKINLHPSNPSSSRVWEQVDNRIQNLHAGKYVQLYEAKPAGPSLSTDNHIEQSIAMAEDGYGIASAIGTDQDGADVSYTTADNPETFKLDDEKSEPSILVEYILPYIQRMINRVKGKP
ncbi:DUF4747 family protein [Hymenobacter norwichensis]|uniref:DUF4747 family protein n=1 Tax=Hymenobacter norwichensis TaxID=223903 RepID=UPI0003B78FFC|nr:DUF4747 family protein [Hymenobacter norwichensis]